MNLLPSPCPTYTWPHLNLFLKFHKPMQKHARHHLTHLVTWTFNSVNELLLVELPQIIRTWPVLSSWFMTAMTEDLSDKHRQSSERLGSVSTFSSGYISNKIFSGFPTLLLQWNLITLNPCVSNFSIMRLLGRSSGPHPACPLLLYTCDLLALKYVHWALVLKSGTAWESRERNTGICMCVHGRLLISKRSYKFLMEFCASLQSKSTKLAHQFSPNSCWTAEIWALE